MNMARENLGHYKALSLHLKKISFLQKMLCTVNIKVGVKIKRLKGIKY